MGTILCPICHNDVPEIDQAFLDECFHCYCFECIKRWARTQKEHTVPGQAEEFTCPLCKTAYASVIYDCKDHTFRRASFIGQPSSIPTAHEYILNPAQRNRRAVYFSQDLSPLPERSDSVVSGASWAQLAGRSDVQSWVNRELQALLLENDIGLVAAVVLSAVQRSVQEAAVFKEAIKAAAEPFLTDKASTFASELHRFVASGRTISFFDCQTQRLLDQCAERSFDTMSHPVEDGPPSEGRRDSDDLSSSRSDDRSSLASHDSPAGRTKNVYPSHRQPHAELLAKSDSDDYLDVLLHQTKRRKEL